MGSLKTSCATTPRNVVTQKKKQLSLIRSVFLPPGLQSGNMILLLFPVTTPCSSKARPALWTSLSFSVIPLPSLYCGSKGVFRPRRLGLCQWLLLVKHALRYLFLCEHTLLNWSRKTQPPHGSNESSWSSRGNQGWHGEGSAGPAKSMAVQGLGRFSLFPCTSLPRHTTMST